MSSVQAPWSRQKYRIRQPRLSALLGITLSVMLLLVGCAAPISQGAPSGKAVQSAVSNYQGTPVVQSFDPGVDAPLPKYRIVAAYGILGGIEVNGPASTLEMLDNFQPQLQALGKQYADLDPTHPVKYALDLVVNSFDLCQSPRYCSSWATTDIIDRYVAYCQQHDMLLFLDVQLGTEPVTEAMTNHLLPYLQKYPFVELALDTEFHFPDNAYGHSQAAAYGRGWMDVTDINWTIDKLAQLSLQKHLPRKVLLVHQFATEVIQCDNGTQGMVCKNKIKRDPNVSIVFQTDGFGAVDAKLFGYYAFVQQQLVQYGGYKVFFHYPDSGAFDTPLQSPADVMRQLFPQPLFISYQ